MRLTQRRADIFILVRLEVEEAGGEVGRGFVVFLSIHLFLCAYLWIFLGSADRLIWCTSSL